MATVGTYIYIDGGYLRERVAFIERQLGLGPLKLNYATKFQHFAKTFYFDCAPPKNDQETPEEWRKRIDPEHYFDHIKSLSGFHVYEGYIAQESKKKTQKGVDVELTVRMLTNAFRSISPYVTLLAGDADFVPVVKALIELGIDVTIWHFHKASSRLIHAADRGFLLDFPRIYPHLTDDTGLPIDRELRVCYGGTADAGTMIAANVSISEKATVSVWRNSLNLLTVSVSDRGVITTVQHKDAGFIEKVFSCDEHLVNLTELTKV